MKQPAITRMHAFAIALVVTGIALCCVAAIVNASLLGWWQVPIYLGATAALSGVWWFWRELSTDEIEIERLRSSVVGANEELAQNIRKLEDDRKLVERELRDQAGRLDQREHALASRLIAFHEWLEFPVPIDLAHPSHETLEADGELRRLVEKDRQLNDLLRAETAILFDYIKDNRYSVDGKFQFTILRDDLYLLVGKVARIYRPDVGQPLLETSLEQGLRAAGRACLQLLIVFDELPISVKDYNVASLYSYIRQAVKAYGYYKSAEPYWNYFNTAWYLGRFAMGASPITLGTWWFIGTLGKQGAKAITTRVVNRQALALLNNLVRVIGYEVAAMYGGDFRHRDANWIYAAELTELVAAFPLSRDSLRHGLREIGALQFRSEYDRVFLTRCLANGSTAKPARFRASVMLNIGERRAIAQRLERFLEAFVHGKTTERINRWQEGVETRLDVKLSVAGVKTAASHETQVRDGLRSLSGFLVTVKEVELSEVLPLLHQTKLWAALDDDARPSLTTHFEESPVYHFEQPDLDPDSEVAAMYLDDVAMLAARVPPHDASIDELLRDVAQYLRFDPKKMTGLVEQHLTSVLHSRFADGTPRKVPISVSRPALDLLGDERAEFLYSGVRVEPGDTKSPLWLLGTPTRMVLFSAGEQPQAIWKTEAFPQITMQRKLLQTGVKLAGGDWLAPGPIGRTIFIAGPLLGATDRYFAPLLHWRSSGLLTGVLPRITDASATPSTE